MTSTKPSSTPTTTASSSIVSGESFTTRSMRPRIEPTRRLLVSIRLRGRFVNEAAGAGAHPGAAGVGPALVLFPSVQGAVGKARQSLAPPAAVDQHEALLTQEVEATAARSTPD